MAEEEIVNALVLLLERGEDWFERRFGAEALSEAEDLRDAVAAYMEGESGYGSLWEDFLEHPREMVPEMTGALEALSESQPSVSRVLNARLQSWRDSLPGSRRNNAALRDDVEPLGDVIPDVPTLESDPFERSDGEYLYGNLERGYDRIDEDPDDTAEANEAEDTGGLHIEELEVISEDEPSGVERVFDGLMQAVMAKESISLETRSALEQALQTVRVEAFNVERAGPQELARLIRNVIELDPEIGRRTVNELHGMQDTDRTLREALALIETTEPRRSR